MSSPAEDSTAGLSDEALTAKLIGAGELTLELLGECLAAQKARAVPLRTILVERGIIDEPSGSAEASAPAPASPTPPATVSDLPLPPPPPRRPPPRPASHRSLTALPPPPPPPPGARMPPRPSSERRIPVPPPRTASPLEPESAPELVKPEAEPASATESVPESVPDVPTEDASPSADEPGEAFVVAKDEETEAKNEEADPKDAKADENADEDAVASGDADEADAPEAAAAEDSDDDEAKARRPRAGRSGGLRKPRGKSGRVPVPSQRLAMQQRRSKAPFLIAALAVVGICIVSGHAAVTWLVEQSPGAQAAQREADLRRRFDRAVERWRKASRIGTPAFEVLLDIREDVDAIIADGIEGGSRRERAIVAEARGFFERDAFREAWTAAAKEQFERVLERVEQARDSESYDQALGAIRRLPEGFLEIEGVGERIEACRAGLEAEKAFVDRVAAFIDRAEKPVAEGADASEARFAQLEEAAKIHEEAGDARGSRAHFRLIMWLARQSEHADDLWARYLKAYEDNDEEAMTRYFALLDLVVPDVERFMAYKAYETGRDMMPGSAGIGTGFFVGRRHILTNAHVVGDAPKVTVEMAHGETEGTVLARHVELDLALVFVRRDGEPLLFAPRSIAAGRSVFAYGYGRLGLGTSTLLVTKGTVSATELDEGRIIFDAKVNPGNSGGPLVDAGGRWVGVVAAKSYGSEKDNVDSFSFAVHGLSVIEWLAEHRIEPPATEAAPETDVPPDEEIRRSIVRIITGGRKAVESDADATAAAAVRKAAVGFLRGIYLGEEESFDGSADLAELQRSLAEEIPGVADVESDALRAELLGELGAVLRGRLSQADIGEWLESAAMFMDATIEGDLATVVTDREDDELRLARDADGAWRVVFWKRLTKTEPRARLEALAGGGD